MVEMGLNKYIDNIANEISKTKNNKGELANMYE